MFCGAPVCKYFRSRNMLNNEYLVAKVGSDKAENTDLSKFGQLTHPRLTTTGSKNYCQLYKTTFLHYEVCMVQAVAQKFTQVASSTLSCWQNKGGSSSCRKKKERHLRQLLNNVGEKQRRDGTTTHRHAVSVRIKLDRRCTSPRRRVRRKRVQDNAMVRSGIPSTTSLVK